MINVTVSETCIIATRGHSGASSRLCYWQPCGAQFGPRLLLLGCWWCWCWCWCWCCWCWCCCCCCWCCWCCCCCRRCAVHHHIDVYVGREATSLAPDRQSRAELASAGPTRPTESSSALTPPNQPTAGEISPTTPASMSISWLRSRCRTVGSPHSSVRTTCSQLPTALKALGRLRTGRGQLGSRRLVRTVNKNPSTASAPCSPHHRLANWIGVN
eukprot:COSAG06_NODE_2932_length_6073_cov_5.295782_7_plen_214_part_00